MDEVEVLRVLARMNTWWNDEPVPDSLLKASHRRRDFFHLKSRVQNDRPVLTIRGPRQVGKTTIVGQLIDYLLDELVAAPEHVLYINAENSQILSHPEDVISSSLDVYQENVLSSSIRQADDDVYVFVDEIQKITGWPDTVKYYTDTFDNLRFVVTGSVSTLIQQDASETLVGRLDEYLMLPMKFVEYVHYFEILDEQLAVGQTNDLRQALEQAVRTGDYRELSQRLVGLYGRFGEKTPEFKSLKDDYLLKGGYPGVIDEECVDAYAILDSNLRNTVTGDIPTVFEVQKPKKLLRLLDLAAYSSGQKISVSNLAETTGINRETVDRYLGFLEEFFLVERVSKFATSEYRPGGRDKVYVRDVGLLNTLNANLSRATLENPTVLGQILETACYDHLKRLQFYLSGHQNADVAYWDGRGEVDFVLSGQGYVLPVEVKAGDSTEADLRGLRNFMDDVDCNVGLVVNDAGNLSQGTVGSHDIVHIPSWLFFYLC